MQIRGDTQAAYGHGEGNPALDDVSRRLVAIDGASCHGFFFNPEVRVWPWAHLQGITRLPVVCSEPWFVISKHHHKDAKQAGLLFVRYPNCKSKGEPFYRDKQPGGPGVGQLARFWARTLSEHPGGLQSCGRLLAVAQEFENKERCAFVTFVDARDPERPSLLPRLVLDGSHGEAKLSGSTSAALTRLHDGHYLLMVYRYQSNTPGRVRIVCFRSSTAFLNANSGWQLIWDRGPGAPLPGEWIETTENIALLNQADGRIFLAALRGKGTNNHVDLYRLNDDGCGISFVTSKAIRTLPGRGTLRAGGGLYIAPSGELVLYAVQQAGGGPVRDMMIEEFSV